MRPPKPLVDISSGAPQCMMSGAAYAAMRIHGPVEYLAEAFSPPQLPCRVRTIWHEGYVHV